MGHLIKYSSLAPLKGELSAVRLTEGLCCLPRSELDLDLDAGGNLEVHQGLDRLLGGGDDVDEALVGAALELLTAVLVLVDGAQDVSWWS